MAQFVITIPDQFVTRVRTAVGDGQLATIPQAQALILGWLRDFVWAYEDRIQTSLKLTEANTANSARRSEIWA